MGASINRGPQNKPKYTMLLIIGTTKMGPLIFGNPHMSPDIQHVLVPANFVPAEPSTEPFTGPGGPNTGPQGLVYGPFSIMDVS